MNYTVTWLPAALGMLARIWTDAADRNAVTAASNRLDRRLATDPLNEGESREGDNHIAFESPLRVLYRVDPGAREVHVWSVGTFARRS